MQSNLALKLPPCQEEKTTSETTPEKASSETFVPAASIRYVRALKKPYWERMWVEVNGKRMKVAPAIRTAEVLIEWNDIGDRRNYGKPVQLSDRKIAERTGKCRFTIHRHRHILQAAGILTFDCPQCEEQLPLFDGVKSYPSEPTRCEILWKNILDIPVGAERAKRTYPERKASRGVLKVSTGGVESFNTGPSIGTEEQQLQDANRAEEKKEKNNPDRSETEAVSVAAKVLAKNTVVTQVPQLISALTRENALWAARHRKSLNVLASELARRAQRLYVTTRAELETAAEKAMEPPVNIHLTPQQVAVIQKAGKVLRSEQRPPDILDDILGQDVRESDAYLPGAKAELADGVLTIHAPLFAHGKIRQRWLAKLSSDARVKEVRLCQ